MWPLEVTTNRINLICFKNRLIVLQNRQSANAFLVSGGDLPVAVHTVLPLLDHVLAVLGFVHLAAAPDRTQRQLLDLLLVFKIQKSNM